MILEFRPAAHRELVAALQWYLSDGGPAVAARFGQAVEQATQLLASMPQLGTPSHASPTRGWPLKRFPFTLVYRVQGERLTVIAVAHQSREPGYWVGRG
ncbi:type II toxin-antitoxin system RelE/ParE family toxin [Kinneretia asaccharophila]|uniref:type II toxin-antitoxin system RelE/ParE family toxin n=1 Tax=Roseateles asaccharophilus TaxID=582607 RepID=UPI00105E4CC7|nr:type II toxin-antitoxin system RelE/ParE family toxin [Roseateles asaccharophilus]MDN3542927.1 type II toxin-antitoxin system RelE/ParE family toxin [Roseateles asaccharophilus]